MEELSNLRPQVRPLRTTAQRPAKAPAAEFSLDDLTSGSPPSDRGRYRGRRAETALNPVADDSAAAELAKLKKIDQAAVDYEAFFVRKLVEAMRVSPAAEVPGGQGYRDLAETALAEQLSRDGGLGLAEQITTQVARQEGLDHLLDQYLSQQGQGRKMRRPASHMTKPLLKPEPTAPAHLAN